jgi:hypothetical protein
MLGKMSGYVSFLPLHSGRYLNWLMWVVVLVVVWLRRLSIEMGSSQFNGSYDLFGGWLFFLPLHNRKYLKGLDGVLMLPMTLVTHSSIGMEATLFNKPWLLFSCTLCWFFFASMSEHGISAADMWPSARLTRYSGVASCDC